MTLTQEQKLGTDAVAKAIIDWHFDGMYYGDDIPAGFDYLDAGSQRTVYLHRPSGTVYKVGQDSANREECRVLADLRRRSLRHAPDATLWTADVDILGFTESKTCVAMPYLPEDGSVPHTGMLLEGAGDLNPNNVHANGGQLWLIDAGGL